MTDENLSLDAMISKAIASGKKREQVLDLAYQRKQRQQAAEEAARKPPDDDLSPPPEAA